MGPENGGGFSRLKATMQKHKIPTVFLEKQEFSQHIPNVNLADGNGALIDTFAWRAVCGQSPPSCAGQLIIFTTLQMFRISQIDWFYFKEINTFIFSKDALN